MPLSAKQAARQLGISRSKLYELAAARKVPHYRIDGKLLFEAEDLATYKLSCRVGPTPAPRMFPRLKHIRPAAAKHASSRDPETDASKHARSSPCLRAPSGSPA